MANFFSLYPPHSKPRFVFIKTPSSYNDIVIFSSERIFCMPVDRLQNLLLLGRFYANGGKSLSCAAVRTDQRLVILSGKCRSAVVSSSTKWTNRQSCNGIISHG